MFIIFVLSMFNCKSFKINNDCNKQLCIKYFQKYVCWCYQRKVTEIQMSIERGRSLRKSVQFDSDSDDDKPSILLQNTVSESTTTKDINQANGNPL